MDRKIRVLLAKAGCDIHERGILTMLNVLRDNGMEVIYTGRYQSPEAIANAAITEDVDVIGISDQTGSLPIIYKAVIAELEKNNANDIHKVCGGLISAADVEALEAMGVKGNWGPGTDPQESADFIKKMVAGE